jgi:hypothetical protein
MTQSCNLLPAFLGGAWASVLVMVVSLSAAHWLSGIHTKLSVVENDEACASANPNRETHN